MDTIDSPDPKAEKRRKHTEYMRRYYQKNKEKISQQSRDRYRKNLEINHEKQKTYYQKNKERIAQNNERYRKKNPEKSNERRRRWANRNREKVRESARKSTAKAKEKDPEGFKARRYASKKKWVAANREYVRNYEKKTYAERPEVRARKKKSIKKWRKENPDKYKKIRQRTYQNNKASHFAGIKKWRLANPEAVKSITKRWRSLNPASYAEMKRRWRKQNPDKVAMHHTNRRVRKKFQTQGSPLNPLIAVFYSSASRLSKIFGILFQVDHIVPLSKGGLHCAGNLQYIPKKWNQIKTDKVLQFPVWSSEDFDPIKEATPLFVTKSIPIPCNA